MDVRQIFAQARVVPVLTIDDADIALDLAHALVAGGLSVIEITLRTPAALAAVQRIAANVAGAVPGVGTLTRTDEIDAAIGAGARFAVSPGFDAELAGAARKAGLPYMPAVQTGSEIMAARRAGCTALKFFPAKAAGGVQALKSFVPVFADVVFCPTGGVTAEDFMDYLRLDNVVAAGGSWMAPADLVKARDWRAIEALARRTRDKLR